ncbi:MAG TPA: hypothetical protein PLC09_06400 [Holophaga sp.]|nr:hypothetical protein [Holophaga sp.]
MTNLSRALCVAAFAAISSPVAQGQNFGCVVEFSTGTSYSILCQTGRPCTFTRHDGKTGFIDPELAHEWCE